jgi:ppGpp synthetase/RelA/SpoT-type nucleotidyltranferase
MNGDHHIAKALEKTISAELSRISLLFRVFYRVKTGSSLTAKFERQPGKYSATGKKVQDLFGFRVTLYFSDDILIAKRLLSSIFHVVEETVDETQDNEFGATRCNIVYRLPEYEMPSETINSDQRIDDTFEIQLRTVLSEGWHEVEHDLRYKCKDDWKEHGDLGRALNGILASLETSDWGMSKLFEDLAYRHYKSGNWNGMLRNKFRLRLSGALSVQLEGLFKENTEISKKIFRTDRGKLLDKLSKSKLSIPMNMNNVVYLTNFLFLNFNEITKLTPKPLLGKFKEHLEQNTFVTQG